MRLNLTIITDWLDGFQILQKEIDKGAERKLKYAMFYNPGMLLEEDVLYIAQSEKLDLLPRKHGTPSLICLGYPPNQYYEGFEYLCLPSSTDITDLMNKLNGIFNLFGEYDEVFRRTNWTKPSSDVLEMLQEIFKNPVYTYDKYEKLVFSSLDEQISVSEGKYEGEYLGEVERDILHTDKEFQRTLDVRGVGFSSSQMYKTSIVFYNIRSNNSYQGRTMVSNLYRPFKESDFSLIEWLGKYVESVLTRNAVFKPLQSQQFENLIHSLIQSHAGWPESYSTIIGEYGWQRNDRYTCITITGASAAEDNSITDSNQAAYYLQNYLKDSYISVMEGSIFVLLNMTHSDMDNESLQNRLRIFLKYNNYYIGISESFSDLSMIRRYFDQSKVALNISYSRVNNPICDFSKEYPKIFFNELRGAVDYDTFVTGDLQRLIDYDKTNNSSLYDTLKTYLAYNQNVNAILEPLHIARTTAIYRMNRIKEIGAVDFDDKTQMLYLRVLFELHER